jgi:hypothetical protein
MGKKSAKKKMGKAKKTLTKQATKKVINKSIAKKESVPQRLTSINKGQLKKKAVKKSKPKTASVQPIAVEATGKCVIVYMGNTYCEDGITKSECDAMAHTYPGAIPTWTEGATCPPGCRSISSFER